MPDPTPGEIAYAAFVACLAPRVPWDAHPWAELPPATQRAWEAAAEAVLLETCQAALGVVRHWNEFGPEDDFMEKVERLERWLTRLEDDDA